MSLNNAPFRADHVGSLLRPAAVRDARGLHAEGRMSAEALRKVEDEEITRLISRQESIGLHGITDGECRRANWMFDFQEQLLGVTSAEVDAVAFQGAQRHRTKLLRVTGKLDFRGHSMLEDFRFLQSHTGATAKYTIPSPTMLASVTRDWRETIDTGAYPDLESMYHDLALAYRKVIRAFFDAGCRYLQLDDCSLAFLCDPKIREQVRARGDDPERLLDLWVTLINSTLADKPAGMLIATHVCRGNFRSTWLASGGYEPVAEALFGRMNYDAYFLEYDTDRAGGFEPLRYLSGDPNKKVVLGLVTSKTPELEERSAVARRIDQAARFVDLSRLCVSPQCGFASTEHGNTLTEQQQWAKLEHCVAIATEVWGGP